MQSIVNGRVGGTLSSFCFCIALALVPLPATALPLLSEVFYDAAGSDDGLGFVELHGEPGTSLVGFTIEGVNGANGAVTHTLVLAGVIPADGIFVLADAAGDGASLVTDADLVLNFDFHSTSRTPATFDRDRATTDTYVPSFGRSDHTPAPVCQSRGCICVASVSPARCGREMSELHLDDGVCRTFRTDVQPLAARRRYPALPRSRR
jgi:hypothetical protein